MEKHRNVNSIHKGTLTKFDHWSIHHINKEANIVADVLAKDAMGISDDIFVMEESA